LLFLSLIFAISTATASWYGLIRYETISSEKIDDKTYYLTVHVAGFGVYPRLELHKCNSMGFFCNIIYTPDKDYHFDDKIEWEISKDNETLVTIFVNDEAIHSETISEPDKHAINNKRKKVAVDVILIIPI